MSGNPIIYTSTDYASILADINSDQYLVDRPEWFKRIWAGVGDNLHLYMNAVANQMLLRTAFTRSSVADLCRLIDYTMTEQATASNYIHFYLDPTLTTFPVSFTASDLKARSIGAVDSTSLQFESRTSATVAAFSETFTASGTTHRLTVARVYTTGEKVRVSSAGTLPTGLSASVDYYALYYSATQIYLCQSALAAYQGTYISISDAGTGAHTITLYSFQQLVYQQESIPSAVSVGTSDGITTWQTFRLPDKYIISATLAVTINSVSWSNSLSVNSLSTDTHYRFITLDNGDSEIQFGDGVLFGAIPGAFAIMVQYATGGGINSNVYTLNKVSYYAGTRTEINAASNYATITGGADAESIEEAKNAAPILLKARSRAITTNDITSLSENYAGVLRAGTNKNTYGLLSSQVVVVPDGGGTPSPALLAALQTYLINLTILESMDIRCIAATYVSIDITATVKILSGYTWATVQGYVILACRLFFSEITQDIINTFNSVGISSAITYINSKWSTSFTANDGPAITRMLQNVTAAYFGEVFELSDFYGFIDSFVMGVDYILVSSPSFPITTLSYQITTDNISSGHITQIP